jgi:2-hydroxy-3-keto-5-methylthiopentenyl-1-phosphate phosphatase
MFSINVVCDFDGTIALEDVTDSLLDRFADASWKDIERQWLAGLFGSRECMARQVALLRASRKEMDDYLDTVRIDPSFESFVEHCETAPNVSLTIVSDGIDYAVRRILGKYALSRLHIKANALVALPDHRYRLHFPYAAPECAARAGTCKCVTARKHPRPTTIVIGDGASDFCVASQADFVFAKDRLLTFCKANSLSHLPFGNFFDIEREFSQVVETVNDRSGVLANNGV